MVKQMARSFVYGSGLAVAVALLASILVLPYGWAINAQLGHTFFIIPLISCFFLVRLWLDKINVGLPIGGLAIILSATAAIALNVYHGSSISGFAFGVLWLTFGLCVILGRGWLSAASVSGDEISRSVEVFLISLSLLLVGLTVAGEQYLNLVDLIVVGPFHFPLTHGGFSQPNNFGSFIALAIGYSFWCRYTVVSPNEQVSIRLNLIKLAVYLVFVGAAIQADSRVGLLAIIMMQFCWLTFGVICKRSRIVKEMTALTLMFVGLIAFESAFFASSTGTFENSGYQHAFSDLAAQDVRLSYWLSALLSQSNSLWLGSGFNSFHIVYPATYQADWLLLKDYPFHASSVAFFVHNELLNLWVSGGIFGIVFIALPLAFGLIDLSGASLESKRLPNLFPILPLALHCFTEFPLWQSGLHWLFLALFLIVVRPTNAQTVFCFKHLRMASVGTLLSLFLSVAACSIDVARVGHSARLNELHGDDAASVDEYIGFRSGHEELKHWAFQEGAGHKFIWELYWRAVKENRTDLLTNALPQMKKAVQFNNTRDSWSLLALGYFLLNKKPELEGFLQYVERLDREHAMELRQRLSGGT